MYMNKVVLEKEEVLKAPGNLKHWKASDIDGLSEMMKC